MTKEIFRRNAKEMMASSKVISKSSKKLSSSRLHVLFMIDSLAIGGAERMAVNIANIFATSKEFVPHLCATRCNGPLRNDINTNVSFFLLKKKWTLDPIAIIKLIAYIKSHNISIIHAHSSSLFLAVVCSFFFPKVKLIWHIHFGSLANQKNSSYILSLLLAFTDNVIVVNDDLRKWVIDQVGFDSSNVFYLPNFVIPNEYKRGEKQEIVKNDDRVTFIAVANVRPQKDYLSLIRSLHLVVQNEKKIKLLVCGNLNDEKYVNEVLREVEGLSLEEYVEFLGERTDVSELLANSDIAVLGSISEGLPLAILEYGLAGLPVIATNVGQIAEVLDYGMAGVLVEPGNQEQMTKAICSLINNVDLRKKLGHQLRERVLNQYSAQAALEKLSKIYFDILK